MALKAIVIAGTVSGVGKTTIATGIMGALARRGLKVQPFKAGPDYIDPTYHTWAIGTPSRNLDTWMLSHAAVKELFARAASGKDIAVVEGVMGLFDGRSAVNDEGSTAEVAKLIGAPVILVVDSRKGARSIAAMVSGYKNFDPHLNVCGVILNGISSERHLELCRDAVEHYTGAKVVGYLPRRDSLTMPERHLGLIPTVEGGATQNFLDELIAQIESTFDMQEILRLSEQAAVPAAQPVLFPAKPLPKVVKIAVAQDKAFSFYYQDSLDLLEAWGAELAPFSPLEDSALPKGASCIYIGGGFPELYAEQLAANSSMKKSIQSAASRGVQLYAECGGLMYLGESLRDMDGKEHKMAGVLPLTTRIDKPKLNLGYRTVEALADGPLLRRGEAARGHEFHWSVLAENAPEANAYRVGDDGGRVEGYQRANVLASYIHFHLGAVPTMAKRMVDFCLASIAKTG